MLTRRLLFLVPLLSLPVAVTPALAQPWWDQKREDEAWQRERDKERREAEAHHRAWHEEAERKAWMQHRRTEAQAEWNHSHH